MPEILLSFCICLSWRASSPAAAVEDAIFSLCIRAGVPRGPRSFTGMGLWTQMEICSPVLKAEETG